MRREISIHTPGRSSAAAYRLDDLDKVIGLGCGNRDRAPGERQGPEGFRDCDQHGGPTRLGMVPRP